MRSISVIIPTLDEETTLPRTLGSLKEESALEIIVADGGSGDQTREVARAAGAMVTSGDRSRARQMNSGASLASGEILLFLHADTLLPPRFPSHVHELLARPGVCAGAFELRIDSPLRSLRLIEKTANWRARYLGLPYGDQALFLPSRLFHQVGGYADMPILEDLDLVRRLRSCGKVALAPAPALTSARRWNRLGPWTTTVRNYRAVVSYYLGTPPSRIARWYHRLPDEV